MSRAVDKQLVALALAQDGVVSQHDAVRLTQRPDAVRNLVSGGYWQEVLPGVLAPAAVPPTTALLERASQLWAPGSALSHYSAARRDGIWVPDSDSAWITCPWEDPARSRPGLEVFRTRQMPGTLRSADGVTWTPAPRTVVDLASQLTSRQFASVLLSGIRVGKATAVEVEAEAVKLRGRKGVAMVREATALWTPERQSLLEDGLYADACAVVGSRMVTRQHPVYSASGSLLAKLDVAIPELKIGLEADGLVFHSSDEQIAADQQRDRRVLARGWSTTRFREGPIGDRATVQRDIRAIVEQRRRQWGAA